MGSDIADNGRLRLMHTCISRISLQYRTTVSCPAISYCVMSTVPYYRIMSCHLILCDALSRMRRTIVSCPAISYCVMHYLVCVVYIHTGIMHDRCILTHDVFCMYRSADG